MKLLVVMDRLWEFDRPTTKIAYNLMRALGEAGVECHAVGPVGAGVARGDGAKDGITLFPFGRAYKKRDTAALREYFERYENNAWYRAAKPFLTLRHPGWAWQRHLQKRQDDPGRLLKGYKAAILRALAAEEYRAVVAIYFPPEAMQAVAQLGLKVPTLLYQLDPWGLIEGEFLPVRREERVCQETAAFAGAAHIFTTPALVAQYAKTASYAPYTGKMTALDFPNLVPTAPGAEESEAPPFAMCGEDINLLYAGSLWEIYRDPGFFIAVMRWVMAAEPRVKFWFMGVAHGGQMDAFARACPGRVVIAPPQNAATALAAMRAADVLVNIGNMVQNQLPSKLTDYLSAGKPIVNTCKRENDLAQAYLARYPLALHLHESECPEKAAQALLAFLAEKGKARLPFADVAALYGTAAPAYAARQILAALE